MIRIFVSLVTATVVTLGMAPAAPAAAAPRTFCSGVSDSRCAYGGDVGAAWAMAYATSASSAKKLAATLLANAKAVRKAAGAPEDIDIWVVKGRTCYRRYLGHAPSRGCVYRHVVRHFGS
ncbi:hypothetical protein AB0B45_09105 [Nonomuraea sp. NPDC049152]|uniref:hypothetical protein n=1 Tax=Nonomuraea sp. NPDC049152 TaxID=3154350 RepID=UPI0033C5817D